MNTRRWRQVLSGSFTMTRGRLVGGAAAFLAVALMGLLSSPTRVKATPGDDRDDHDASKIRIGYDVAPVRLDLAGKDWALVGLGSYLVNVQAACNDCHSAGPQTQYVPGGNPYFGQPAKVNPATYLGGGRDFGQLAAGSPFTVHIISRNLTPDKTGRPEGGHTFEQFLQIMRTGVDMDHLHPNCLPMETANCLPPPFDGALLQIMPWPEYQNLTDRDLRAVYEYLKAIPCVEGPTDPTDPLHNDCK